VRRLARNKVRVGGIWLVVLFGISYVTYSNIREQDCDRQFRAALIQRAADNKEADRLEKLQEDAIGGWVNEFSNPPPGIESYGPERYEWMLGVSGRISAKIKDLGEQRNAAIAEQAKHPLPELTCGK
jgi:hypothetical protein